MEKCIKIAALYIATLRAMALIHQRAHWLAKGNSFYGNHLLFERLYNSALEDLDLAAEKFIGVFDANCLTYELQTELLSKVLSKYNNVEDDPVAMSMNIEKDFIKLSSDYYKILDEEGQLTLGVDDMISVISSKREESVYLLKQTMEKE